MTDFAKSSAHNLCEEYKTIFINYKKYGSVVLDVDLKNEPEIRAIILKSETLEEYQNNIKEFWIQNFRIFISNCSDIEKDYDSGIYDDIFVITDISKSDLSGDNAVISADCYTRLCKVAVPDSSTDTFVVYVETDKFIYKINLGKRNRQRFIKIDEKRIAKDSIVTDF